MGRNFSRYADIVESGIGAWALVSVISGERRTVGFAVVYIPRHTDYPRDGGWAELH
ncbi:hypothetical protein YTPLAS72_10370 [Nitrospira sp.]|nr:hypothetical protein YTPLAS72_10370 [Nitrospira sp.]